VELIGCTTDKKRVIVALDFLEVQTLLNGAVQESERLDRTGRKRGDPELISAATFMISTANALDQACLDARLSV